MRKALLLVALCCAAAPANAARYLHYDLTFAISGENFDYDLNAFVPFRGLATLTADIDTDWVLDDGVGESFSSIDFGSIGMIFHSAYAQADRLDFSFQAGEGETFEIFGASALFAPGSFDGHFPAAVDAAGLKGGSFAMSYGAHHQAGRATGTIRSIGVTSGDAAPDMLGVRYSYTISAVPEPASWAMMVAGFGLAGGWIRRARPRPQAA
ncbi:MULTISPECIES: PEPxxWA-CTERM sorting domain-containing protein [Sphingomonas]|nr:MULTISPECIES: PEPxxWA-CTERM sorting domain-containing protein [Sphingomonas]